MVLIVPFLLLLFVLAFLFRVDLFFTIGWTLLGLYVLSRPWMWRAVRQLYLWRRFPDRAFSGDEVQVDLTIRNTGLLPVPWLQLRGAPLPEQVVSLGAREERHFSYTLRCQRRGYHTIGPFWAETGDVLGLERQRLLVPESRRLTVYPRVVPLQRLGLPTRSALVALPSRISLFEDPYRITGTRDYQPGDPMRRIHWSASAGAGRLLVKQLQPATARETLICLDLDLGDYHRFFRHDAGELAIVVATSLAHHIALEERLPVGLSTEAHDPLTGSRERITLPPCRGRAALVSLLDVLARVQMVTDGRFVDLLRQESARLTWGATMVIVTGRIDEELREMMLYLQRDGRALALILVQPDDVVLDHSRLDGLAGVRVHRVWNDQDLGVLA